MRFLNDARSLITRLFKRPDKADAANESSRDLEAMLDAVTNSNRDLEATRDSATDSSADLEAMRDAVTNPNQDLREMLDAATHSSTSSLPETKHNGSNAGRIVTQFKNTHITFKLLLVVLIAFAVTCGLIAANLDRAIIPDEVNHFGISKAFSTTWGIPKNSPATYTYGAIGVYPYFYYWINGRVLNLFALISPGSTTWDQLVVLRYLNVIYSLMTLVTCYLLAKVVIKNRWWQLLTVFMLGNTLMFAFLSAGVSYDNLTNLLCLVSLLFLVKVLNHKAYYINSLLWMIFISLAAFTKVTVLPLAIVMFIVWGYFVWKCRRRFLVPPKLTPKLISLVVILLVALDFNMSIYGVNLFVFNKVNPACTQILTADQCNQNVVEKRNATTPVVNVNFQQIARGEYPDPVDYAFSFWIPAMISKMNGIYGHRIYYPEFGLSLFSIFYLFSALIAARYFDRGSFSIKALLFISLVYSLVLFYINYTTELTYGFLHYAVQGRYLFPILGISYIAAAYFMAQIKNRVLNWIVYGATALIFLVSGPILIATNYSSVFFSWLT